jgi:hypothetical protein
VYWGWMGVWTGGWADRLLASAPAHTAIFL